MAIPPPLDKITNLPAEGVNKIQQEFDKIINQTLDEMRTVITDSVKLPQNIKCDDPKIKKIKDDLTSVQVNLQKIQDNIPKIQQAVTAVTTIVNLGLGIKNAIAVANLSNPLTAAQFIAATATTFQDELITNALAAITPLQALPVQTLSKLQTLIPALTDAIGKLNRTCNDDTELHIPVMGDGFDADFDYNDLLPSDFYRDINVSETDLGQRSDTIQQLVEQQQNLLTSLLEAPSQVYKQDGVPPADLGKTGDFYVDTQNNIAYGPKLSDNVWGGPLN